jgi:hypothetical protein
MKEAIMRRIDNDADFACILSCGRSGDLSHYNTIYIGHNIHQVKDEKMSIEE